MLAAASLYLAVFDWHASGAETARKEAVWFFLEDAF